MPPQWNCLPSRLYSSVLWNVKTGQNNLWIGFRAAAAVFAFQTTVCKVNQKAEIMTTGPEIKDIL